jgi:signal transduction histidine kinase
MFFSCEMPSQFKRLNLNKVLLENIDLLSIQLKEKDIKVEKDLSPELPMIRLDNFQFSQVIINLTLNAIAAMERGGTLRLKTNRIDQGVLMTIADNGSGIEQQYLEKVFEPFFTTKNSGTGLGLAVVYGIVEAHRGAIKMSSEVGVGTEFRITLKAEE